MRTIQDRYAHRTLFTILMAASVLFGAFFFVTNHLDFIIAAINKEKLNVPNIAYAASRIISGVLIPFVFAVPSLFPFGRVRMSKIFFILFGILHALTLSWIFYFLASNSVSDLLSNQQIIDFQKLPRYSFVPCYVNWDTYSWAGSIFTFVYSILSIFTGISFDDNRKKVRRCVVLMLILRAGLPFIYNLILGNGFISGFWLINNYADVLSQIFFTAAICMAAVDDIQWVSLIWDQEVSAENDDVDNTRS